MSAWQSITSLKPLPPPEPVRQKKAMPMGMVTAADWQRKIFSQAFQKKVKRA